MPACNMNTTLLNMYGYAYDMYYALNIMFITSYNAYITTTTLSNIPYTLIIAAYNMYHTINNVFMHRYTVNMRAYNMNMHRHT